MQWARRRRRPEGVRSAASTRGHAAGTQRVLTLRSHAVTAAGRFSMSRRHSARRRASRSSARAPSCRQWRRTYVRILMNIIADATASATVQQPTPRRRRAAECRRRTCAGAGGCGDAESVQVGTLVVPLEHPSEYPNEYR